MEIIFNGKDIYSEEDFYNELCKQDNDFGCNFGRNISALEDFIDLLDGKTIIWKEHLICKNRLGNRFELIISLINKRNNRIKELERYNQCITLKLE